MDKKRAILLDTMRWQRYTIDMISISNFDSSYSPNEASEQNNNYMDCGGCYDTGIIEHDVYCDCMHGKARIRHDEEDSFYVEPKRDERMDSLHDEYRAYGDC